MHAVQDNAADQRNVSVDVLCVWVASFDKNNLREGEMQKVLHGLTSSLPSDA